MLAAYEKQIKAWLVARAELSLDSIPFHISELLYVLPEPHSVAQSRAVTALIMDLGWTRWHTRRERVQCWLFVPFLWREHKARSEAAKAAAVARRKVKPAISPQWATIAAGLVRGSRVVVRGREEARALLNALQAIGARGEVYRWKDHRCVVTHVGKSPLMDLCRCCRMGQCEGCQRGYVRSRGLSPIRCECGHGEFIEHVGPNNGTPRLLRTRAKGSPVPGTSSPSGTGKQLRYSGPPPDGARRVVPGE